MRKMTGVTKCDRCGETIQRSFLDQRWSNEAGDVCFKDTESGFRIHRPEDSEVAL